MQMAGGGGVLGWVGAERRKRTHIGAGVLPGDKRGPLEPGESAAGTRKEVSRVGSTDRPLGTRRESQDGAEPEWPGGGAAERTGGPRHPLPALGKGEHKALGAQAGKDCSRRGTPERASGAQRDHPHSVVHRTDTPSPRLRPPQPGSWSVPAVPGPAAPLQPALRGMCPVSASGKVTLPALAKTWSYS